MTRTIWGFILFLLMNICLPATALNVTSDHIKTSKLIVNYQPHLPKEYDENRSRGYPVIYILSSEKLSASKRNKIYNTVDNMSNNGLIEPIIAVLVNVDNAVETGAKDIALTHHRVMQEAINYVDQHYNSRSQRDGRLLLGGQLSVAYGLLHPEQFKGIVTLNFSGLFGQHQGDEDLVSRSIAHYVQQSVRLPVYIVAGDEQGCSYHENKLQPPQNEKVNNNIQAVELYQKLHKTNLFQQNFDKYASVPASPAELRILHGNSTKNAWLSGLEEGLKFFFNNQDLPITQSLYDPSMYQARHQGVVLSNNLTGESSRGNTPMGRGSLSYKTYLPYGYDAQSDIKYPVLYLLHGSGGNDTSWNEFWPILDMMIEQKTIPPLIAVAPISGNSYWIDSDQYGPIESLVIKKLIPEVDAKYHTLRQKSARGIVGFSMGGYGALRYSLVYPQLFSSAVLLSPAIQHDDAPITSGAVTRGAFGVPFSLSKWNALNYPAALESYQAQQHRVSMYIITGDDDWNHLQEKDELPKDAYRYNMEVQAVTLHHHLTQLDHNKKDPCFASQVQLHIVDGGHDLDVWAKGFQQGVEYMFTHGLSQPH